MSHPPLQQIAKYHITDLIGEGAMGVVYRARDSVLERYVAIKVMSATVARDADLRSRFLREAQAAGSLQHPNIITIYDFGETEGHLYIAMEYLAGADLAAIIERREAIPLHAKLDIILDVLNGLAYAHSKGVVHRDIKPANIRVSEDGHAKVMDFGIAHLNTSDLTKSGVMIGTPNYMAPEQVTGADISAATDVFAAGAVLYELLTYARPFQGETLHTVLFKVVSEDPPALADMVPGLPPSLQPILQNAMAKDPAARYPTAEAMANEISVVRAALSAGPKATVSVRSTPLKTLVPKEALARPLRWGWIAAGGVVALAGLGAWLLASGRLRFAPAPPPAVLAGDTARAVRPIPPADTAAARRTVPTPPPARAPRAAAPAPPAAVQRNESLVRPVRQSALASRARAVAAGATDSALAAGDGLLARADSLTSAGKFSDAVLTFSRAGGSWDAAEQAAQAKAAAAAQPPVVEQRPPPPAPTPAAPVDPRPEIERLIADYAQALESGDVNRVRAAYPGLTSAQQRNWEQFFRMAGGLKARLELTQLRVAGAGAEAQVSGTYEYLNRSTGRRESQPVSFQATLDRPAAGAWRIATIR